MKEWIKDWCGYFFDRRINRLVRLYLYYKVINSSYDFDYGYTEELFTYSLERLLNQLKADSSFVVYENNEIKALELTIKLLKTSEMYFYNKHAAKWGDIETSFEGNELKSLSKKAIELGLVEQEEKERRYMYQLDDIILNKRKVLAYKIIAKYYRYWRS
jgi:hypothetical protein